MLFSSDVALQIGQQQSMFAMQQQQADQVWDSLRRSQDPQYGSPALAGKAFNAIGAVGAPIGGLALGLAGMDPAGLGMRVFGGARAMGMGFAGAGAAGLGAFGVGTAGMMAAAYIGNQLQQGAQQQQHFMMGMQRSFNFMTPQGMGFNNSQLNVMGGQLRQMSGQIGPQGQMVGFEELSSLAQNMGKMGLTSGSQDVSSFTTNFRKMLQTVKHIATELGGSLQEAQQVMAGMRNSGVFRAMDQTRMASEIRNFSIGGNISTGDLTQSAGFGSQISRAIGGRGVAGAYAGVRTRGEIGLAVQAGVLSDEDIYNATGMRGAEGQQAYAAAQLQGAAAWLKGGRGRRFVASLAGADGRLDPASVADWQNGNMGIGRTMQNAYRNLNGIGRANFIRNEGRLRGEALGAFGGNLPAMALQQWAESKGVDIHNMDDRSMLFAQRQLGMDREMVDNAVKMLDGMPAMLRQQRYASRADAMRTELASHKRTSGIEGAKRKMEETREHVQNRIQGVGQQVYSDLMSSIDSWLQEQSGHIARQASQEIDRAYEALSKGQGGKMASTLFGTGAGKSVIPGLGGGGGGMRGGMSVDLFNKGSLFGVSMNDKMAKAGYNFSGVSSDKQLNSFIAGAQAFSQGAQMGNNAEAKELGSKYSGLLNRLYEGELGDSKGTNRYNVLREQLQKEAKGGSKDAAALLDKLSMGAALSDVKGNRHEANFLASLELGANVDGGKRIGANSSLPAGTGLLTSGEGEAARIRRYGGGGGSYKEAAKDAALASLGLGEGSSWKTVLGAVSGAIMTGGVGNVWYGATRFAKNMMKTADANRAADAEGQRLVSLEGMTESQGILEGKDMSESIRGRMRGLDKNSAQYKTAQDALQLNKLTVRAQKGEKIDWDSDANKGLKGLAGQMHTSLNEQRQVNRTAAAMAGKYDAIQQLGRLSRIGLVDEDGTISDSFEKKLGAGSAAILQRHLNVLTHQREGKDGVKDFEKLTDKGRLDTLSMLTASTADLQKAASSLTKEGAFGMAGFFTQALADRQRAERAVAGGNVGVASALGVKLSWSQQQALQGMKAGDARITSILADGLGIDLGASQSEREGIDKDLAKLEEQHAKHGAISESDYQDQKRALEQKRASSAGDEDLAKKLADITNSTGEERRKKLQELQMDPEYQKRQEETKKKQEEADPSVARLSKIAQASEDIRKAVIDLPTRLGVVLNRSDGAGKDVAGVGAPKGE